MKKIWMVLWLLLFASINSFGQSEQKRRMEYNVPKNALALAGYDAVSYFNGTPQKGQSNLAVKDRGIIYYFSSARNKALFLANPSVYEPQYGGWCAYAMGKNGEKVEVDPMTFKIVNGKLYLFYNKYFTNTLKYWNKNERTLKDKADQNWMNFLTK